MRRKITYDEWDKLFEEMKRSNVVSKKKRLNSKCGRYNSYYDYCSYINSVLKVIRGGEQDYCYFTYQIRDLLRFEPNLNAIYDYENDVFIVWLEKEEI